MSSVFLSSPSCATSTKKMLSAPMSCLLTLVEVVSVVTPWLEVGVALLSIEVVLIGGVVLLGGEEVDSVEDSLVVVWVIESVVLTTLEVVVVGESLELLSVVVVTTAFELVDVCVSIVVVLGSGLLVDLSCDVVDGSAVVVAS